MIETREEMVPSKSLTELEGSLANAIGKVRKGRNLGEMGVHLDRDYSKCNFILCWRFVTPASFTFQEVCVADRNRTLEKLVAERLRFALTNLHDLIEKQLHLLEGE